MVPMPGHTPEHLCVVIESSGERLLLLGDTITSPVQIEEPNWHSFGDGDPQLAAWTRDRLWRELADPYTIGVGAHSPSWSPDVLPIESSGDGQRFAGNDVRHTDERHRRVTIPASSRARGRSDTGLLKELSVRLFAGERVLELALVHARAASDVAALRFGVQLFPCPSGGAGV